MLDDAGLEVLTGLRHDHLDRHARSRLLPRLELGVDDEPGVAEQRCAGHVARVVGQQEGDRLAAISSGSTGTLDRDPLDVVLDQTSGSASNIGALMFVSIQPGSMALTRMPCSPTTAPKALTHIEMPPLVAQ